MRMLSETFTWSEISKRFPLNHTTQSFSSNTTMINTMKPVCTVIKHPQALNFKPTSGEGSRTISCGGVGVSCTLRIPEGTCAASCSLCLASCASSS